VLSQTQHAHAAFNTAFVGETGVVYPAAEVAAKCCCYYCCCWCCGAHPASLAATAPVVTNTPAPSIRPTPMHTRSNAPCSTERRDYIVKSNFYVCESILKYLL
jgi:hypothetical protein